MVPDALEEHRLFRETVRESCERALRPLVPEAQERFSRARVLPAIARVALFLARGYSDRVTGQLILSDGGQSLLPRYLEGVERAAAPEAGTGR